MCLVKCLPPAYYNRVPPVTSKPISEMRCYSLGEEGVAGRIILRSDDIGDKTKSRDRGIKISIKRLSRNALYFESDSELLLTSNYQLSVQPLGILVGYLRIDPNEVEGALITSNHYIFITDTWLSEKVLTTLAMV